MKTTTKQLTAMDLQQEFIGIKCYIADLKDSWDGEVNAETGLPTYYVALSAEFSHWLQDVAQYSETVLGKHVDFTAKKYQKVFDKHIFEVVDTKPITVWYHGLEGIYAYSALVYAGRAIGQSILGGQRFWNPVD